MRAIQAQRPPEPKIQALWDRGEPSPTYVYRRGDSLNPGQLVGPGVPSVLTDGKTPFVVKPPWPGAKQTGRRLALARWLTQPDHPLTARVAVNRIWKQHFGTGIAASLGNFGKAGTPPTHPELLDWLAREFVRQGWSMKAMHRVMMTSTTYRQSSASAPELAKLDPANAYYSRMPLVRLDAESLYDSLLLVAGRLDEARGGPADPVQARRDGLVTPTGTATGWRRLVYVQQMRKQLATHLETFDFPQMNPNCIERRDSTVAPQALHLLNNAMVEQLAVDFAKRVRREAGNDAGRQIDSIYLIALSRLPTADEMKLGREALVLFADEWEKHLAAAGKLDRDAAELKALATYLPRDPELGELPLRRLRCEMGPGFTRRELFESVPGGIYGAALASLLGADAVRAADVPIDLKPRKPHFPAKAKAVIHLFMNGGPSQMDLFDPKPALDKQHGKPYADKLAGEIEFIDKAGR